MCWHTLDSFIYSIIRSFPFVPPALHLLSLCVCVCVLFTLFLRLLGAVALFRAVAENHINKQTSNRRLHHLSSESEWDSLPIQYACAANLLAYVALASLLYVHSHPFALHCASAALRCAALRRASPPLHRRAARHNFLLYCVVSHCVVLDCVLSLCVVLWLAIHLPSLLSL